MPLIRQYCKTTHQTLLYLKVLPGAVDVEPNPELCSLMRLAKQSVSPTYVLLNSHVETKRYTYPYSYTAKRVKTTLVQYDSETGA